jgi:hypothetical protein
MNEGIVSEHVSKWARGGRLSATISALPGLFSYCQGEEGKVEQVARL